MKMFEVGGCVRDELLGLKSKDIDFTVVLEGFDIAQVEERHVPPFSLMVLRLQRMGFKIFLESPEFLTVRAQFPNSYPMVGNNKNLTADFVLARKESDYTDGRRPDKVEVGTLEDDLARRDFTMNAIAKDADGSLIDPFNGREDIDARIIRAVGDPMERLMEDALRALRALRFSVTKGFTIEEELANVLASHDLAIALERISDERIQQELSKMFRFNSQKSLYTLGFFPLLTSAAFSGSVSLDATMKTKGRGK